MENDTTESSNVNCPVTISTAEPADFPSLASIFPLANASNPIHHLMFKRDTSLGASPSPAERCMMAQFSAAETSTEPKTHILKAVPVGQESAVGFAIVTIVEEPKGARNRREGGRQWDADPERRSSGTLRLERFGR